MVGEHDVQRGETRAIPGGPVKTWLLITAVLAVVTVARIVMVDNLADQGFFAKYPTFARAIIDGEMPVHRLADLSPGYLLVLVVMMGPLALDPEEVRAVQIGLVSVVALLCGLCADRLSGRTAAAVAMLCLLGSRAALVNATELEPETLVLLLNTCGLCCLLLGSSARTRLAAGLCFGLSAITRPTVLLPAAALGLLLWSSSRAPGTRSTAMLRRFPAAFLVGIVTPVAVMTLLSAAIPGSRTPMNPGTVFYEGCNPSTTGLAGDAPRLVKEVESAFGEPDALHLAYRQVATRALGAGGDRREVNAFWWSKARAFLTTYPSAWLRLLAHKLRLALSSYDAWDLATMVRKERELGSRPWIPFGLLVAASLPAVLAAGRWRWRWPLVCYSTAYLLVMVGFYVTARQRNPLLPALAILAGLSAHRLVALWQSGTRRQVVVLVVGVAAVAAILSSPGHWQREDSHAWTRAIEAEQAHRRAAAAETRGEDAQALTWRAAAALRSSVPLPARLAGPVRQAVAARLSDAISTPERFDLALAAMRAGDWATAERLLRQVESASYRPLRGSAAVSSVAFHRARCLLHLGQPESVPGLLETANRQAPGCAQVLALDAALAERRGDAGRTERARQRLQRLHDPFTARLAMAEAAADMGDRAQARTLLERLVEEYPEWPRPRLMLQAGL